MDMQYAGKIFTIFQRLHTTEQYSDGDGPRDLQEDRRTARREDLGGVSTGERVDVLLHVAYPPRDGNVKGLVTKNSFFRIMMTLWLFEHSTRGVSKAEILRPMH